MRSNARVVLFALSAGLLLSCGAEETPPSAEVLEARRLLTDAGFPGGEGFPELTLLYNTADYHKRLASALQEMWRVNLGIKVELVNTDWKVYLQKVQEGEFDIARRGWVGEWYDPTAFLGLFSRESKAQPTGWSSHEFESLLRNSRTELDPKKRKDLLDRADEILLEEAPLVATHHYVAHNYLKTFIKGVHHNARDIHPLQGVTLKGDGAPGDGVLIFNASEEPGSLDPALSHDIGGLKTLMHLFEGLVSYSPEDASPIPGVARSWDVSPDGKTYTFHLRKAAWTNGDPVTSRDFVYAWRRVVDPKVGSRYADRMFLVRNARSIVLEGASPETLGIRAPDERTFVVELEHAAPYFLQLLCLNVFYPVHRKTIETHGDDWTRLENMVHNGPYRLTHWKPYDRKIFEKNPRYRAPEDVKLEKFVFVSIRDDGAAFRAYEAGQCHWLFRAPLEFLDELRKRPDYMSGPYNAVYFYIFNTKKKPLDDVRVRRALSLAVDRKAITTAILKGGETPADRLVPPTSRLK